jgi:N-hydroxyarylamine O-acetyltransferase
MSGSFDLAAYCDRIGFEGLPAPDLLTLNRLVELHAAAIPFENLNPLLDLPVELDIEALERKMVRGRRGGWCFEQNRLFAAALETIGFAVSGLAGRVLLGQAEDAVTMRGHMLLRIEIGGESFIADVGFGGRTLTSALRLEEGIEQQTPHGPFRLIIVDGDWRLQAQIGGEWKSLFRFDLQRQYRPDYEVANYYLSTKPSSFFRQGLLVARSLAGRRVTLFNCDFSIHPTGAATQSRVLETVAEILDVLCGEFGLDVSELTGLEEKLAGQAHARSASFRPQPSAR